MSSETLAEQTARIAGYREAIVGLTPHIEDHALPHVAVKYNEGFAQGRLIRAARFGERDRKLGRPASCPDEFTTNETRDAYRNAYSEKG